MSSQSDKSVAPDVASQPDQPSTPRQTANNPTVCDKCLIEQYKAYLGDLGNIGARHAQTNTFYVSILSALLVFLSLTGGEKTIFGKINYAAQFAAAFAAILLCLKWFAHMKSFGSVYLAKFEVLRELEMKGLPHTCFKSEQTLLKNDKNYGRFTSLESAVALLLMIPFVVVMGYAAYSWWFANT